VGTRLRLKNEDELEKVSANKEIEVVKANLRAWNYWSRIWQLERKNRARYFSANRWIN